MPRNQNGNVVVSSNAQKAIDAGLKQTAIEPSSADNPSGEAAEASSANGDDGDDSNSAPQYDAQLDNEPSAGTNDNGERMFTQSDVSRMMAREKQQGRSAVYNELGIDPNDTKAINTIKAIFAAVKQDEEPPVAPSAEVIEAQNRATIAEAKAEAMMLGANSKYVDDIVTLATARIRETGNDDYKAVVGEIKTKYPVWFGKDGSDGSVGSRGTGTSVSASSQMRQSGQGSLGKRLADARRPAAKRSPWDKN